jgi:hypothetical protein
VINVCDDGDISNVLHRFQNSRTGCLLGGKGQAKREGKNEPARGGRQAVGEISMPIQFKTLVFEPLMISS